MRTQSRMVDGSHRRMGDFLTFDCVVSGMFGSWSIKPSQSFNSLFGCQPRHNNPILLHLTYPIKKCKVPAVAKIQDPVLKS